MTKGRTSLNEKGAQKDNLQQSKADYVLAGDVENPDLIDKRRNILPLVCHGLFLEEQKCQCRTIETNDLLFIDQYILKGENCSHNRTNNKINDMVRKAWIIECQNM